MDPRPDAFALSRPLALAGGVVPAGPGTGWDPRFIREVAMPWGDLPPGAERDPALVKRCAADIQAVRQRTLDELAEQRPSPGPRPWRTGCGASKQMGQSDGHRPEGGHGR